MRQNSLAIRGVIASVAAILLMCCLVRLPAKEPGQPMDSTPLPAGLMLVAPETPIELVGSMKSLNHTLSQKLHPADNAVNLLMIVFGPNALEPEVKRETYELLGLKKLPDNSPLFVSLEQFTEHLDGVPADKALERAIEIQADLFECGARLWSREELPQLGQYLDANAEAMTIIAAAARKPGYYAPLLSVEQPPRLLSAALNVERRLPFLSRMFAARALLHLQENDEAQCIADLMTCHKLAWNLAQGSPFDVSGAKAHVIDSFGYRAEAAALASGKFQGEHLVAFATAFQEQPPLPTAERAIDLGERAIVHQEIELLSTDDESVEGFFEHSGSDSKERVDLERLDWKQALASADTVWDQIVQALKTRDRNERAKQFGALDEAYQKWEQEDDTDAEEFQKLLEKDPAEAGRRVGKDMAMSLRPLWWQRQATDDRAQVRRDLIQLGLALARFRSDRKAFPATLNELAPEFLPAIPTDPHTGGPYVYSRPSESVAEVMSTGLNGQNDAGLNYNDDQIIQIQ